MTPPPSPKWHESYMWTLSIYWSTSSAVSCLQQVWPIRQICRDLVRKVYRTSLEQINWKIALTTSHFRLFCFVQNNFAKKFSEPKRKSNCSPSALFFKEKIGWITLSFMGLKIGRKVWQKHFLASVAAYWKLREENALWFSSWLKLSLFSNLERACVSSERYYCVFLQKKGRG